MMNESHSIPSSTEPPLTIIQPVPGWRVVDLGEFWRYRELLFFLAWRDIKVRYKQTVLGTAWAVLQPVMAMLVFTLFFGRLGKLDQFTDVPYPIFVFAGLLPWNFFAQAVSQSGHSLITEANLLTKVYFPRLIIPCASTGGLFVDFLVSFVILALLMVWYGVPLSGQVAMVPALAVAAIFFTLGVGTTLSALAVTYRDFRYVIPFMIQMWMFVSPVAYPLRAVPEQWRLIYALNPMAGLISGFRSAILGEPFQWPVLSVSAAVACLVFLVGVFYFRRVERRFADIV